MSVFSAMREEMAIETFCFMSELSPSSMETVGFDSDVTRLPLTKLIMMQQYYARYGCINTPWMGRIFGLGERGSANGKAIDRERGC